MEILLLVGLGVGFYMAWGIGANDVANSMADAVGSKALGVTAAVILAAIFEFAGAFLMGGHVTDTVSRGIIDPGTFVDQPEILATGLVCALLAAAIWLNVASYFGVPVSTTHSTVGAVAGFGMLWAGVSEIQWSMMGQIVASWFISPISGGVISFLIFKLITYFILAREQPLKAALIGVPVCTFWTFYIVSMATIYKGLPKLNLDLGFIEASLISGAIGVVGAILIGLRWRHRWQDAEKLELEQQLNLVERVFMILVIITSCSVAFSHGANDVANAIGPVAAVVSIVQTGEVTGRVEVSLWLLALGGGGIVVGLATYGYRVMRTVGSDITEISPSRGVAADLGTAITVLTCSRLGLPVSTTHTLVGAIIGVGLARGISAINLRTIFSIFASWIITLPVVGVLTMLIFFPVRWIFGF